MPDDNRPIIGFDLNRVATIKQEAEDEERQQRERGPGRPRRHAGPRQLVQVMLPVDLVSQIDTVAGRPGLRTAFIEQAIRAALAARSPQDAR